MSDQEREQPASLPQRYRAAEPPKTLTIADLGEGRIAYTETDSLRIDANWGVWLDPTAWMRYHTFDDDFGRDRVPPIKIMKDASGIKVYFSRILEFESELHTSFAGYIPAAEVVG